MSEPIIPHEAAWKRRLTAEQYRVTRLKGTERAFSGEYSSFNGAGRYRCVCCGSALFGSEEKFRGPSKWPTFWAPIEEGRVKTEQEIFHFMIRNQVSCSRCDAHLGYVFEDGRPPKGVRYFINSAALVFEGKEAMRCLSSCRQEDWNQGNRQQQ